MTDHDLLDEDTLRGLVRPLGGYVAPPRSLALVDARAGWLARRRTVAASVLVAATACSAVFVALTAASVATPAPGLRASAATASAAPRPPFPAPSAGDCLAPTVRTLTVADVPDLLYLPDLAVSGRRVGPVYASKETRGGCPDGARTPGAATTQLRVHQYYGTAQVDALGDWWFDVTSGDAPAGSGGNAPEKRTVMLSPGAQADWTPMGGDQVEADSRGSLRWRDGDGRTFEVAGEISLTTALAVARSLEKVAPGDPRLAAD